MCVLTWLQIINKEFCLQTNLCMALGGRKDDVKSSRKEELPSCYQSLWDNNVHCGLSVFRALS